MNPSPRLIERLAEMVRRRNRELAFDALLKAALGIGFSLITFGVLFWFGWVLGFFFGGMLNLHPWQFGAIFGGIFLIAAIWSAWRRVDPLADVAPLTDRDLLLMQLSRAAIGVGFSPRHASAGLALVLIGGPAAVIEALGIWAHRLPADEALIDAAARMLVRCESNLPITLGENLAAAYLLYRLALIKVVPHADSHALTLTDKGHTLRSKGQRT